MVGGSISLVPRTPDITPLPRASLTRNLRRVFEDAGTYSRR